MKKLAASTCFLITTFFALSLFGCKGFVTLDFICFNTQVYITVNGGKITSSDENELKSAFFDMHTSLSVTGNGEVAALNLAAANEKVAFGIDAFAVLNLSKNLHALTNGYFNPAVLPLSRLWKLSSDTFDPKTVISDAPSAEEIENVLPLTDFDKVLITEDGVYKTDANVAVDLGGIAKGYATDFAKTFFADRGVNEGYISVGGSSLYIFSVKEDLGIKHPRRFGEQIIKVDNSLIGGAYLSTSGDYIRYYMGTDGKRYSHIINGFTGYPTDTGLSSVTVIAGKNAPKNLCSAAATDALSTALMLMGKDAAISFIKEKLDGLSVFMVYESSAEKLIISNTQSLTVLDGDYTLSVI